MLEVGVTPALRRRRERAEHQRSLIQEQAATMSADSEPNSNSLSANQKVNHADEVSDENRRNAAFTQPISERISNLQKEKDKDNFDRNLLDISREASVKDLTERLQVKNLFPPPRNPEKRIPMKSRIETTPRKWSNIVMPCIHQHLLQLY